MKAKNDVAKLEMSDILCGEYENPKRFSDKFLDKYSSEEDCGFSIVHTKKLMDYFNDSNPVTYVLGSSQCSPTGEKYVKIHIEGDSAREVEGVLLCLLKEYRKRSIKNGKKYLYWRLWPYISSISDDKWLGRVRLLYSKKDARKIVGDLFRKKCKAKESK